jgi:hypothetical protein
MANGLSGPDRAPCFRGRGRGRRGARIGARVATTGYLTKPGQPRAYSDEVAATQDELKVR